MRFRVTRTARRHLIGNAHILAAIQDAGTPNDRGGRAGATAALRRHRRPGVQLHVVAIPDNRREGWLAIIHAMPTSVTETDFEQSDDPDTGAEGDTS
jgi:hypothetical protein